METLKGIFQCPQKLTNVIQTSQNSPWLSLRSLNKWYGVFAPQYKPRALPEGAFCGAGIEQLCLAGDFYNIGPRACENCKGLVEVNLTCTEITALLHSTFAHCVALNCIWLPPRLTQICKEVFLDCVALQEVVIPTELCDIGIRAFWDVSNCNAL